MIILAQLRVGKVYVDDDGQWSCDGQQGETLSDQQHEDVGGGGPVDFSYGNVARAASCAEPECAEESEKNIHQKESHYKNHISSGRSLAMLVGVTDVGKRLYVCDEYIPGTQLPVGIRQNPVDEILVHVLPYPDGKILRRH